MAWWTWIGICHSDFLMYRNSEGPCWFFSSLVMFTRGTINIWGGKRRIWEKEYNWFSSREYSNILLIGTVSVSSYFHILVDLSSLLLSTFRRSAPFPWTVMCILGAHFHCYLTAISPVWSSNQKCFSPVNPTLPTSLLSTTAHAASLWHVLLMHSSLNGAWSYF